MKKIYFIVLAVIAAVTMGCSNQSQTPQFDTTKLWPAVNGEKWGYIDAKGTFVIPAMYDEASGFSCGQALVYLNGKIQFISTSNKMLSTISMDYADDFYYNHSVVSLDGKYGIIDNSGKVLCQPIYAYFDCMGDNGLIAGRFNQGDKTGYYDKSGKLVLANMYESADVFENGCAAVSVDGEKYGVIDKSGNWLVPVMYDQLYSLGKKYFCFYQNGKYGIIDSRNNVKVQPVYDEIYAPVSNGLMLVAQGDKYGYIDYSGNVVLAPIYVNATEFYEGIAWVKISEDGNWTGIDTKGNVVISLSKNERYVTGFHNGLALIWKSSDNEVSYRYIDKNGAIVYTWSVKQGGRFAPKAVNATDLKEMTLHFNSKNL